MWLWLLVLLALLIIVAGTAYMLLSKPKSKISKIKSHRNKIGY